MSFATPFDVSVGLPAVNATGTRFVWGTSDGAVYVADMPEVKRRLEEFGLD